MLTKNIRRWNKLKEQSRALLKHLTLKDSVVITTDTDFCQNKDTKVRHIDNK